MFCVVVLEFVVLLTSCVFGSQLCVLVPFLVFTMGNLS